LKTDTSQDELAQIDMGRSNTHDTFGIDFGSSSPAARHRITRSQDGGINGAILQINPDAEKTETEIRHAITQRTGKSILDSKDIWNALNTELSHREQSTPALH
jgi:hypothetical protein